MQAAHAVTGKPSPYADGNVPPKARWKSLVREVAGSEAARVVISSEGFADADDAAIREIVRDLDGGRLHVLITLRPLAAILPSQWQQYVQGGIAAGFERARRHVQQARHRDDAPVLAPASASRAGRAVGEGSWTEHVTVIVASDGDREHALRIVEQMTGLRTGTLEPEPDLANCSLTQAEVETVRAFNIAFRSEGLSPQLHAKVMRFGAAEHLKRRPVGAGEARIATPAWAVDAPRPWPREIVDGIGAFGGPRHRRPATARPARERRHETAPKAKAGATASAPDGVWSQIGAATAAGILLASGLARGAAARAGANRCLA